MFEEALRRMQDVANDPTKQHIIKLNERYKETREQLLALDTERNFLSRDEFEKESKRHMTKKMRLDLQERSQEIDKEYFLLLAEIKKIHAETRALIQQAIFEISGLPHELQPAL